MPPPGTRGNNANAPAAPVANGHRGASVLKPIQAADFSWRSVNASGPLSLSVGDIPENDFGQPHH